MPLSLENASDAPEICEGAGQGFTGQVETRTWLLPLIPRHVHGSHLGYWGKILMPTARGLANLAKELIEKHQSKAAQAEALKLQALELQIWQTLPAFCCWPRDGVNGIM
jgi:NUC173 domain